MGFGFVEFKSAKDAQKAIKVLQGTVLEGHALDLKLSRKKLTAQAPKDASNSLKKPSTKLIARNIAFEVSI